MDPALRLAGLAGFLGLPSQGAAAAAKRVTFSALQEQEQMRGFREKRRKAKQPFFRQGRTGAWRTELGTAQCHRLENAHGRVMRRLAYL